MVLPLNLAMTPAEIRTAAILPKSLAWMSCHFCPYTEGITNIPEALPEGAMLILNDRERCDGHSRDLVANQLLEAVHALQCESVLLDFQRPQNPESAAMVKQIVQALPCPVAVTEPFSDGLSCPVFLAPCPLHTPLSAYLRPWQDREIWMEAALSQEVITVTRDGTVFNSVYPVGSLAGGFCDSQLHCRYYTVASADSITFTLFDTSQTLHEKLEVAHSLGVRRAVGLYQELGGFLAGM